MIRIFFGSPGCGKTTTAVSMLYKSRKLYKYRYANFEVSDKVARECKLDRVGEWTLPPNSYLCIDEAGIEYNSRKFKSLPQKAIEWFKLHRHYKVKRIDIFSQSWEDMDITLRRLADELWYVKKIFCFTLLRRIYKRVKIDKQTEQIIDGYKLAGFWNILLPFNNCVKIVFRPRWYKYFDSYSTPDTPIKYWGVEDNIPLSANSAE